MAELSPEDAQVVVGRLLEAFNERHDTSFSVSASEPPDDHSGDYLCVDDGQSSATLKLQLTRAVAIVQSKEPSAQARAEPVARPMHAWLHNKKAQG